MWVGKVAWVWRMGRVWWLGQPGWARQMRRVGHVGAYMLPLITQCNTTLIPSVA